MKSRTHSPRTREALQLLGAEIRVRRIQRGWSIEALAGRVGVSHPTITKAERGDPTVAIGIVFEAATLVGVPLFGEVAVTRARHGAQLARELELLPSSARAKRKVVDNDF